MKTLKDKLKKYDFSGNGIDWISGQEEKEPIKIIKKLALEDKPAWANWIIHIELAEKEGNFDSRLKLAEYAAEKIVKFLEKEFPGEKKCRALLKKSRVWLKNKNFINKVSIVKPTLEAKESLLQLGAGKNFIEWAKKLVSGVVQEGGGSQEPDTEWFSSITTKNACREIEIDVLDYGINLLEGDKK